MQVVNPYMAYLSVDSFFKATNNPNLSSGYYMWNGEDNSGFIATGTVDVDGNRYVVSSGFNFPTLPNNSGELIPPLQSFFVKKKSDTGPTTVYMSPNWTKTSTETSYVLRASQKPLRMMNIRLSQGAKEASASLVALEGASDFANDPGDMSAIVYNESPLTLYTFAVNKEPLLINVNGMFDRALLQLGMRVLAGGETTLSFANMDVFRHDVTLIDKVLNKEIALKNEPNYTFTINGNGPLEINDRFVLKFKDTASDSEQPSLPSSPVTVSGDNGYISVQSSSPIRSIWIYDSLGRMIYENNDLNETSFKTPHPGYLMYVVKVAAGDNVYVEKVVVK
jgi:hypothetical protein